MSKDDAPALIFHGDADTLVPIQQAEIFVAKAKEVGGTAVLEVKKGGLHGWPDFDKDLRKMADWFDEHLKAKK